MGCLTGFLWVFSWDIPCGNLLHFAIENGDWNSEFFQCKMVDLSSSLCDSLPEGT